MMCEKIKLIADTHTHTISCGHAYSTVLENAQQAAKAGMKFIAITEHGSKMPFCPPPMFFVNMLRVVPDLIDGVVVLKGTEANICNREGELDLEPALLSSLDWVIASYHVTVAEPSTVKDHTHAYRAIAENPDVDVIGHCGDERYRFDYAEGIKAFAKHNKIVEINNHSFVARLGSDKNCREIAKLCAENGVRVVVNTDAHFCLSIGRANTALAMLEEINFPQELIVNADYDTFLAIAREKSGRKLV